MTLERPYGVAAGPHDVLCVPSRHDELCPVIIVLEDTTNCVLLLFSKPPIGGVNIVTLAVKKSR